MIEKQALLDIFFPKEINWERYELIKINEINDNNLEPYVGRLEFVIQERNLIPHGSVINGNQYISKGFFPPKTITDFPVRDRLASLIVVRRRWMHKETKEYVQSDFNVNQNGTKTTFTLLDFLKQDNG